MHHSSKLDAYQSRDLAGFSAEEEEEGEHMGRNSDIDGRSVRYIKRFEQMD